jgi:RND family efflux transporter MFP subunit
MSADEPHTPAAPPGPDSPPPRARLLWIALRWAFVLVAAAGVGALLYLSRQDDAPPAGPGRGRGADRAPAVEVALAGRAAVEERARHPGELAADAVDVAARVAGRLVSVTPRVGDRLAAGVELARVDDAELHHQVAEVRAQERAARAAGARARSELGGARSELKRRAGLADDQLVSRSEIEALEARVGSLQADAAAADATREAAAARLGGLEQRIADSVVTAPFAGVVSRRYLDAGAYVQPGTPVVRLVDGGPLRVRFEVPEYEIGFARPGAAVTVRTPATGAHEAPARIRGRAGEVDPARRTVLLEAALDQQPETWLPGMSAEVTIVTRSFPDALVVPGEALLERVDPAGRAAPGVFAVADGHARWVPLTVLGREADRVAVSAQPAAALDAGTPVVVRGHAELQDGSPVRVTGERGGPGDPGPAGGGVAGGGEGGAS